MTRRLRAPRSLVAPAAALALGAALLTGCSTGSTTASDAPEIEEGSQVEEGAYPVTIEHAFGETTIEEEPVRVATLGWSDQDNVLSLGVVPVGATKLTWGGNEAGSSSWFDEEVEELGAEAPVRYDDADGAPIVDVAKLDPDLILATNSGITEEEYEKLSKIAPVVAYPDQPWTTPWQTQLEMVGEALGRPALAAEVAEDTEEEIAEAREDYPELDGASLIFGYLTTTDTSMVGMYAPADPRVALMHDFGMVDAPSVVEATKDGFYTTVSAERSAELESDVLLTWLENPGDMEKFEKDPLLGQIPAIANGNVYAEADKETAMAVTNPSPLSIPFTIEHFLPEVAKAVDGS